MMREILQICTLCTQVSHGPDELSPVLMWLLQRSAGACIACSSTQATLL